MTRNNYNFIFIFLPREHKRIILASYNLYYWWLPTHFCFKIIIIIFLNLVLWFYLCYNITIVITSWKSYQRYEKLLGSTEGLLKWHSQSITSTHVNKSEQEKKKKKSPYNFTLVLVTTFYWLRGPVKNHFINPPMDLIISPHLTCKMFCFWT